MAEKKEEKPVKTIEFLTEFAGHPAANLVEGATVDPEKRTADTADIHVEVGEVKSAEVPWVQEALFFTAKTEAGVMALANHDYFRAETKKTAENPAGKETALDCLTGLFNYALGLRLRGRISTQMKTAAAGPEKAIEKATKSLEAVAAQLPPEAQAAIAALLKSLGK